MNTEKKIEELLGEIVTIENIKNEENNGNMILGEFLFNGKWIKTYIIKVDLSNRVETYKGKLVGIIKINEDSDDILIVSDEKSNINYVELKRYFKDFAEIKNAKFKCQIEKSAGAILYQIKNEEPYYLIIYGRNNYPGFPKGHVEYGETDEQTAIREVREEVGVDIKLEPHFKESMSYIVSDTSIKKEVIIFLSKIKNDEIINIDKNEVNGFEFVEYDRAKEILKNESLEILKKANQYLIGLQKREKMILYTAEIIEDIVLKK
jgi:tRNA nucleotidyltransferase (CCA-adding enzyme)